MTFRSSRKLAPYRCRLIDDDIEHLLGADRGKRDDRVPVLDREPGEADALPPQQLVALPALLVDLARATGEHEDRLLRAHQRTDVSRVPRTMPPTARRSRQIGTA